MGFNSLRRQIILKIREKVTKNLQHYIRSTIRNKFHRTIQCDAFRHKSL